MSAPMFKPAAGIVWHSVSEKLPFNSEAVLFYNPAEAEPVWLGYIEDGTWYEMDGFPVEGEVTAWCYLPERPQRQEVGP